MALTLIAACGARDEDVGASSNTVTTSPPRPLSPASSLTPGIFQLVTPTKTGSVVGVGDSIPWLVDATNNLFHYTESEPPAFTPRSWVQIAGTASTRFVTASPEGTPWRLDTSGRVFKGACTNNTCAWTYESGITAWEVGVGKNDTAWAIGKGGACTVQTSTSDCPVYKWDSVASTWGVINGTTARHIAVDPAGTAWITTAAGNVFKWVNGFTAWGVGICANNPSTGTFHDQLGIPVVGAGPLDATWIVGCTVAPNGKQIRAWNPRTQVWEVVPGSATTLSVGADGTPWVLDSQSHIFQYQTTWQFLGPSGFTFTDNGLQGRFTGEVQDVSVAATGDVVLGAGSGGVWHAFSTNPTQWAPIADRSPQTPGPTFAVSTVAVAPGNPSQIFAGTGVPFWNNSTTTQSGNGIWFTNNLGASWQPATCDGVSCPSQIVRIRYNGGAVINVATTTKVFSGSNNGVFTNTHFQPPAGGVVTDIVGDPNDTNSIFIGFTGAGTLGGVCKRNIVTGAQSCTAAGGPLAGRGFVRLAVASAVTPTLLFAAAWDNSSQLSGVFKTQTFPTFSANLFNISNSQFGDENGRMTGLAVNPQGTTVLLAAHSPARGSNGGTSWQWLDDPNGNTTQFMNHVNVHDDYHAVVYDGTGKAYLVSDGGYFISTDDGVTWSNANNTFGVANEMSVDVNPSGIYAGAWDTGGHFKTNGGSWQSNLLILTDSNQMVANPNNTDAYYVHAVGTARYAYHGGVWANVDNPPVQPTGLTQIAVNSNTDVFTISMNAVFRSSNWGGTWTQFNTPFVSGINPAFLNVTSELGDNVYVSGFGDSSVFFGGPSWAPASPPQAWTPGNGVCATAIPRLWFTSGLTDYYILGTSQASVPCQQVTFGVPTSGRQTGALYRTSNHGSTWTQLSGSGSLGINQNEVLNAIAIDTSSNSVALATEGLGSSCPAPGPPCGAGIYKLNNPAVDNANIHWRRWINGLPNPAQIVHGLSGQFEDNANGVPIFYYYAAVYGRGIWAREARGGEP